MITHLKSLENNAGPSVSGASLMFGLCWILHPHEGCVWEWENMREVFAKTYIFSRL